jgi:hypothetical protein
MIMMTKIDWKRRLMAKPSVNQKKILKMLATRTMPQT